MDLSQSDLIRNLVLMRLPKRCRTRVYESYSKDLEGWFYGSGRVYDSFIRDYLPLRRHAS